MKKLLLITLLLFPIGVFAQTNEEASISADRPGMATGTDIMPFMKIQWETGFESAYDGSPSFLMPTTMLRFGVTQFAEIRLEYDGTLNSLGNNGWEYEMAPIVVGTKVKIFDGYKWVPKTSLMANLSIPAKQSFDAAGSMQHVAPSLYLLFQNDLTDWFNIGYNIGMEWSGYSHIHSTFLAMCLGFTISDNCGAFLECYNYFTNYGSDNNDVECNIDFGLTYTIHPRVQIDLYGMFNCRNPNAFNGIGFGIAWLIN